VGEEGKRKRGPLPTPLSRTGSPARMGLHGLFSILASDARRTVRAVARSSKGRGMVIFSFNNASRTTETATSITHFQIKQL
jgi:hypothetical protein